MQNSALGLLTIPGHVLHCFPSLSYSAQASALCHARWLSSHCSGSGSAELAMQHLHAALQVALGLSMALQCMYACVPASAFNVQQLTKL